MFQVLYGKLFHMLQGRMFQMLYGKMFLVLGALWICESFHYLAHAPCQHTSSVAEFFFRQDYSRQDTLPRDFLIRHDTRI
jgi:hypothetical protein